MDRIYQDAKDKNVSKTRIYMGSGDNRHVYYDYHRTKSIDKDSLADLFYKGCVISTGAKEYTPTAINRVGDQFVMLFYTDNGQDTAVFSKEYNS